MVSFCDTPTHTGGVFYEKKQKGQKYLKNSKLDLVVVRISAENKLVNARPCYNCLDMMKAVGIRRVYYSVEDKIICEKVNDMVSICSSSVLRFVERQVYHAPEDNTEYFKRLMNMKIPTTLKKYNIDKFLNYNLKLVLPTFSWTMNKKNIRIYDENNSLFKIILII